MAVWGADANGQLGREKKHPEKYDKIIGPYTNHTSPEKGNGVKMKNICKQHHTIPMNAWKRAKLRPKEKKQINESPDPKKSKIEIQKKHTITWVSPDGKTTRQIDYIAINHRYRNAVKRAYAVQGWQANIAQQQQHKVIRMDIRRLKLMKHYKKHKPPETGKRIQYDILKLREDPQKIERWLTQRYEPPDITKSTPAAEDWDKIKAPIHKRYKQYTPQKTNIKKTKHQNGHKKQNNGARKQNGKRCNNI